MIEWPEDKVRALLGGVPSENLPDDEQIKFCSKPTRATAGGFIFDILLGCHRRHVGTSGQLDTIISRRLHARRFRETLDYFHPACGAVPGARGDEEEGKPNWRLSSRQIRDWGGATYASPQISWLRAAPVPRPGSLFMKATVQFDTGKEGPWDPYRTRSARQRSCSPARRPGPPAEPL